MMIFFHVKLLSSYLKTILLGSSGYIKDVWRDQLGYCVSLGDGLIDTALFIRCLSRA